MKSSILRFNNNVLVIFVPKQIFYDKTPLDKKIKILTEKNVYF